MGVSGHWWTQRPLIGAATLRHPGWTSRSGAGQWRSKPRPAIPDEDIAHNMSSRNLWIRMCTWWSTKSNIQEEDRIDSSTTLNDAIPMVKHVNESESGREPIFSSELKGVELAFWEMLNYYPLYMYAQACMHGENKQMSRLQACINGGVKNKYTIYKPVWMKQANIPFTN